jgi:predicted MFS family arabinose efflux permease
MLTDRPRPGRDPAPLADAQKLTDDDIFRLLGPIPDLKSAPALEPAGDLGSGMEQAPATRARRSLATATARGARSRIERSAWRALKHPEFRSYFAGSLISNLGTWLQNTAQVILAYQLTHSVFAVGVVTCAQFSSSLLLGPWAAVVANRIGGRRMLIATQLISAAIAGSLAVLQWSGKLGEGLLVVGALCLGLAFTFALPVQTALVPRLVSPADDTEAAMAMNSVSYNAGRAVAPALCVVVIITIGFAWAFTLNALSFAIFAVALAFVRPREGTRPPRPAKARTGLIIAMQRPRIALLLAMVAAVTLADDPILILGPSLAHHIGVSNDWAGYFLSALGCGTVLGSLRPTTDLHAHEVSLRSRRAATSLLVLVIAIVVFALGISPWLCLLAAFVAGAAALRTGAVTQTQLVWQQPGQVASVMALWAIAWAGTKPLASFTDGAVAAASHSPLAAAAVMVVPALAVAILELRLPNTVKRRIKRRARQWGRQHAAQLSAPVATRPGRHRPRRLPGRGHGISRRGHGHVRRGPWPGESVTVQQGPMRLNSCSVTIISDDTAVFSSPDY